MRADLKCEGVIGETEKQIGNDKVNEEKKVWDKENYQNTDGVLGVCEMKVSEVQTIQEGQKNSELLTEEQGPFCEQW